MLRILYFSTNWCQPCKTFGPIVDQTISSYQGVSCEKIDADVSSNLVSKYGVTSVPTLVFEKNGIVIAKKSGVQTSSELSKMIQANLH